MTLIQPTDLNLDSEVPESSCCECGQQLDGAAGHERPSPGDYSMCVYCTSLNIFDDDLRLRRPTDEEYLIAAADPGFQRRY